MQLVLASLVLRASSQLSVKSTARFSVVDNSMEGPTTNADDKARAAAMRSGRGDSGCAALPECLIEEGRQKYVLIRAGDRHLVRGAVAASYHRDAAEPTIAQLRAAGVAYEVVGGGRIVLDANAKTISVFGHSFGFPWANGDYKHHITADVIRKFYPGWDVTTSNEGY